MIIAPMLAQSAGKPFTRPNHIYEPKMDGIRCIALLDDSTRLQSRSGKDITYKFPELANLHKQVKHHCIQDGEIKGTSFNAVQHRVHQQKPFAIKMAQGQYPVTYNVFDQINLDGKTAEGVQLIDRKDLLAANFVESPVGILVPWYTDFATADALYKDTEGIMAKYMYSTYAQGSRSAHWLKIKNFKEGTFYICGVTEGENDRRSTFGSLILGKQVEGKLKYVGNVGTGFTDDMLTTILSFLQQRRGECPFERIPDVDRAVKFWTIPMPREALDGVALLCEVRYLEPTADGKLRFPSFRKLAK